MLLARRELDGEVSVESLLLGFGETVYHIEDGAFLDTMLVAVIAYLLTADDDGVFVLHFVGEEAVTADSHLLTNLERNCGSSFFADKSVDLIHISHRL